MHAGALFARLVVQSNARTLEHRALVGDEGRGEISLPAAVLWLLVVSDKNKPRRFCSTLERCLLDLSYKVMHARSSVAPLWPCGKKVTMKRCTQARAPHRELYDDAEGRIVCPLHAIVAPTHNIIFSLL